MTKQTMTPIYILSGFLGSGKTTLLQKLIAYWQEQGLLPAVIMNEVGDVNLDGLLVQEQVPMTEMLGGCICCSIRGDLSMEIAGLIQRDAPDVIVVEATGVANPMEILDGVTEAALYQKIELKGVITVVDAAHLLELYHNQKGKTFRLMQEQIRTASCLILNKTDRVRADEQELLTSVVTRWNEYAPVLPAIRCDLDMSRVLESMGNVQALPTSLAEGNERFDIAEEDHEGDATSHAGTHHHTHEHVMVYTHYLNGPVDSAEFESFIANLPREVYRAKGVLTFSDTASRFLFQYAFREPDFLRIRPQGEVPDVVVFIGEHFSKGLIEAGMRALERS
ncbi:CobW family GTP-binding protein [Paenibacillus chibensis]|uniref:CobW family GTP-binding protein n=1 Tax=Paenibacillus chibensis TaxID=59846 RepID=UPI000FDBC1DF|nr:GTP-binding protein [Paenibacillus chibensis]MEC0373471.1 GTP-binding protein [Paenibacillus chibensis]